MPESLSRATQERKAVPKRRRVLLDPQSADRFATDGGSNKSDNGGVISSATATSSLSAKSPDHPGTLYPNPEKCDERIATGASALNHTAPNADAPADKPFTTTISLSINKTATSPLVAGIAEEASRSTTVSKMTTAASTPMPSSCSAAGPTGRDAVQRASTLATKRAASHASLSTTTEQDRARLSQVYDALTQHVLAENDAARADCNEVYDQIEQTKDTFHAVRQGIRQMYRSLRSPNGTGRDNESDDETDRKVGPIHVPHKIHMPAMDLDDAKCWTKISHAVDSIRNQTKELRAQQSRLAAERDCGEASLTTLSETYLRWQARREACMSRLLELRKPGPLAKQEAKKPKAKRSLP
jgi:hypothetical protein